jgi:chemotaxis protein histidine kinase CheA/ActR/RegA family two-component response regulator
MVLDSERQEQARQLFVEEALELLQQIEENLLELTQDPTSSQIEDLLEDVRLIMDGAIEVELIELQIPVARLESILISLKRSPGEREAGLRERLQLAYQDIWSALLPLLPTYSAEPSTSITETKSATTNLLPLNLNETSVKVDFSVALEKLTEILRQLSEDRLVEELKTTAELFLKIAETLQLAEVRAIAETTLTTLQTNPEFAEAIGTSALADWQKVYNMAIAPYSALTSNQTVPLPTSSESEPQLEAQPVVEEQTLSTVKTWLWLSGCNLFVLPVDSINEIINYDSEEIVKLDEQLFVSWQQQQIEFYRISQLLNYNCFLVDREAETLSKQQLDISKESLQMPIVNLNGSAIALEPEVDRFIVKSKLIIKPFGNEIVAPNYLYGCTVLEDGMLAPVIDVKALLEFQLQKDRAIVEFARLEKEETLADPTILIIDDSKTMREILALNLKKEGYRVIKAEDGRTAIAYLQQNRQIKAIICDLEMPDIDGFEFLKYRSQHPAIALIPTIILTIHSSNDYRQLAFKLGATDYFTIPYSKTEFLTLLKLRVKTSE